MIKYNFISKFKKILIIIFNRSSKLNRFFLRHFKFIFSIIIWLVILLIFLPISASLFKSFFDNKITLSSSDLILLITAVFILVYTYETRKLNEESVFQRRMKVAVDINFGMLGSYRRNNLANAVFGELTSSESTNNVSKFNFVSPLLLMPIGKCGQFVKINPSDKFLQSSYRLEDSESLKYFLKAIELKDGEIDARVLITNGESFIYTYKAITENWKNALDGNESPGDQFILIKKTLEEYN